MEVSQNPATKATRLLDAAISLAKDGDESVVAIAFNILRRHHRARPDVQAKLAQLAERKAVWK
jgi:hypothetical protein